MLKPTVVAVMLSHKGMVVPRNDPMMVSGVEFLEAVHVFRELEIGECCHQFVRGGILRAGRTRLLFKRHWIGISFD